MKRLILVVLTGGALAGGCHAKAADIVLAREGQTSHRIVVADDASEPERHAAAELAAFLKRATGAAFPVGAEGEAGPADAPAILVGWSGRARKLVPAVDPAALGPEEFILETHPPHLVLAGGRPRGTLYAVSTFLEDQVGCRWFSSKVERVPSRPELVIGAIRERQRPAFEYREPFAYDSYDGDWAVRNKCNGHAARLDERRGGRVAYLGFVHTFFSLVPPERFFASHPEYFSEINGQRTTERAQLCLTHPGLPGVIAERVLELAKDAPPGAIASVSQNDWAGWCQCARCREVEAEEGGVSGPLLRLVNAVAARVAKVRPDLAIDTLAYQQSRRPPLKTRPLPNVIVRLCSIECSFAHPLGGDGPNRSFARDIKGWSRISNRLYIWDYVTNFAHYIQPHPNFRVLQPNLDFFAKHGVKGVFEQGSYQSPGGEFQELRSWVLAKLLWNPQQNTNRLVDEFLAGYYGPAAGEVRRYFDLIHDAVEAGGDELGCYTPVTARFLSAKTLARADRMWDEAERQAAAANDPGLLQRVREGRLPVDYVLMAREALWRRVVPGWNPVRSGAALRQRFFETAAAAGVTHISEGRTMADFRAIAMLPARREAAPPPGSEALPADRWIDFQDDTFRLANPGVWVALTADPAASDGVAARMPGTHNEWAVQLPLEAPELGLRRAAKWRVAVFVRAERTGQDGVAFTCGIYDSATKTNLAGESVNATQIGGDGYLSYDLGTHEARPGRMLWVAPAANAGNVPAVWVDRVVLTEDGG